MRSNCVLFLMVIFSLAASAQDSINNRIETYIDFHINQMYYSNKNTSNLLNQSNGTGWTFGPGISYWDSNYSKALVSGLYYKINYIGIWGKDSNYTYAINSLMLPFQMKYFFLETNGLTIDIGYIGSYNFYEKQTNNKTSKTNKLFFKDIERYSRIYTHALSASIGFFNYPGEFYLSTSYSLNNILLNVGKSRVFTFSIGGKIYIRSIRNPNVSQQ